MEHRSAAQDAGAGGIAAKQWIRAWRGFACLFWGLPLSALFFFGAIEIDGWRRLPIPPFVVGWIFVLVGAVLLWKARLPGAGWRARTRDALVAAGLLGYFVPLVYWYTFMTRSGWHYTLNLIGILAAAAWMLWLGNRLAGHIGLLIEDPLMATESFLCGWLVAGIAVTPLVLTTVLGSYLAVRHESSLTDQIQLAQQQPSGWMPAFILLPLSLTMASLWKAKERCVHQVSGPGRDRTESARSSMTRSEGSSTDR